MNMSWILFCLEIILHIFVHQEGKKKQKNFMFLGNKFLEFFFFSYFEERTERISISVTPSGPINVELLGNLGAIFGLLTGVEILPFVFCRGGAALSALTSSCDTESSSSPSLRFPPGEEEGAGSHFFLNTTDRALKQILWEKATN